MRKLLTVAFLLACMPFFQGCERASRDDSNIPWARPAHWEGGMPGMGPGAGSGRPRY